MLRFWSASIHRRFAAAPKSGDESTHSKSAAEPGPAAQGRNPHFGSFAECYVPSPALVKKNGRRAAPGEG
jgi:hypothetical protein